MSHQEASAAPSLVPAAKSVDELIRELYKPGAIYTSSTCSYNTLSEKRIRKLSGAIRAKDNWMTKMKDAEIRARWTAEAKTQESELTDKELDYVFDELEYYALLQDPDNGIRLSPVDQVWISDSLIDEQTEKEVKRYAAILENVPERLKDWHPNSGNQVLNLVHPSLFPLIYSRSMLLDKPISSPKAALDLKAFGSCPGSLSGWRDAVRKHFQPSDSDKPEPTYYVPQKNNRNSSYYIEGFTSEKFCWLPTEFNVDESGHTEIKSYINNLHPVKHAVFYPTIAKVFEKFVPLLEQVVTDLAHPRNNRLCPDVYDWYVSDEPEPESAGESDFEEKYEEWMGNRRFVHPQPEPFEAPNRPTKAYSLRGRRLQAIFKMSSIELTPENPEYKGGSWHVEAMANERIIATGIYYYDVENITDSSLAFREHVGYNIIYEQDDHQGVALAYGLVDNSEALLIQEVGQVETKKGRCIVFPNIYQHRVSSFKLADPTKPGYRKIFAFFFIDPATKVPSTEVVPPQQQDWWTEQLENVNPIGSLPSLVKNCIYNNVSFPIGLSEAKQIRLSLMDERSSSNGAANSDLFAANFSLCEH
ncbi:hypothetical protein GGI25_001696 [Coemansia spiralis]|uniref:Uncharacterized protein n=2 Tax=Coemansia TaxID=4863 RepID=A0A9W8KY44_9FUNG|nr:hypothetical protein EDC05_003448 [Coemansia umbellata]KAJ2624964.1 hypothetical protein GGI26_001076 [Coemansia sp. RSA 1358]KAJ2679128.1 hypothetical protein GGI25_001696 [Coemansia spiralis]